jgi:hypothetical protein
MTDELKIILGYSTIAISVIAYIIYFSQTLSSNIKPHAFSWLLWGLLIGIGFAAQWIDGGGPGSWAAGFSAFGCLTIASMAFIIGDRSFSKSDWVFLFAALFSLFLWWLTSNPLLSVIMVTITDFFATLPTLTKSYHKPNEEGATLFALNGVKYTLAIFALNAYSLTTWLFPAYLLLSNATIATIIIIRRHYTHKTDHLQQPKPNLL